ncbi:MAG: metallophosphoesterase [Cetobacterium somerae]
MKKIFVTSDLHFGHEGIIKMAKRPFKNAIDMECQLISNWNSVVGVDDLVYVLGDFAFKGKDAEYYLDKLNGNIILVKGNHDRYIRHKKILEVCDYKEFRYNGHTYIMSHYPLTTWNGMFKNTMLLYGHVHTSGWDFEVPVAVNSLNVNCEFHKYKPILLDSIVPVDFVATMKQQDKFKKQGV